MKVLIDTNLSPEWVATFAAQGWESIHWSAIGDVDAADQTLMDWAKANAHLVFTHDLDFGTALALTHAESPSVLQIRGRRVLPEDASELILSVLKRYEQELDSGALIVVDEGKSRIRILPL